MLTIVLPLGKHNVSYELVATGSLAAHYDF